MNEQELINRRIALAQNSEMPLAQYAEEWNKLAADFAALGMMSNAALCESNWKRYKAQAEFISMTAEQQREHWRNMFVGA